MITPAPNGRLTQRPVRVEPKYGGLVELCRQALEAELSTTGSDLLPKEYDPYPLLFEISDADGYTNPYLCRILYLTKDRENRLYSAVFTFRISASPGLLPERTVYLYATFNGDEVTFEPTCAVQAPGCTPQLDELLRVITAPPKRRWWQRGRSGR